MVARKSFLGSPPDDKELDELLEKNRSVRLSDDALREQRVSFAFGNAPESPRITKDSVRSASESMRLRPKAD